MLVIKIKPQEKRQRTIRMTADLSVAIIEIRSQWTVILKMLREGNCQPRYSFIVNLMSKRTKYRYFTNRRELIFIESSLKKFLKDVFQIEKKCTLKNIYDLREIMDQRKFSEIFSGISK